MANLVLQFQSLKTIEKEKQYAALLLKKFSQCTLPPLRVDKNLKYNLQSYFGVGNIKEDNNKNAIIFYVNSIRDLFSVIIPHFDRYPLITQKKADFQLFKLALQLINEGAHLKLEGLIKILSIKASMNKGLSDKLKIEFTDIIPIQRPLIEDQTINDP